MGSATTTRTPEIIELRAGRRVRSLADRKDTTLRLGAPRPGTLSATYARLGRPVLLGLVTVLASLIALPLLLVLGLANLIVFRDPRKILFFQERVGLHGASFQIVKLRTMWDPRPGDSSWGGDESPRLTPIGRFLRQSHLDELPQLWNILRGEMAVIGPRPEMRAAHDWAVEHVPGFQARLWMRPGITGLAQLRTGYTSADAAGYRAKLEVDLEYMAHLGLWMDLKVLAMTPLWMMSLKGWGGHAAHAPGVNRARIATGVALLTVGALAAITLTNG